MQPIGRNDPCYCGSGKKYKRCHGAVSATSSDIVYDRMRRYDGESANHLLKFAKEKYGEGILRSAWDDYRFSDGTPFTISGPEGDGFTRWFLFNWRQPNGRTLPEEFIDEQGTRLDGDLRRFIEATAGAPYSYYQTIEAEPGVGLTMRDILRRREVRITERSASTILKRGHILYARVAEMDGCSFFMGTGALIIPPVFLDHILALRETLVGEQEKAGQPVSDAALLEREDDLREMYFELEDIMNRPPEIQNTDGDPLEFHTLTFAIPSLMQAFQSLKDLEQKVARTTDEEMLKGAKRNKAGEPTEVTVRWLRKGFKDRLGENTTLGTLRIGVSRLVVEVNSERRARRIKKEIRKRLGDDAILLKSEIRSHEGLIREIGKGGKGKRTDTEHDRLLKESPEVKTMLKEIRERHWAAWLDEPVPALRGMTPREAAKDPQGRELLESLLMDFDLRNEEVKDDFLKVDTARLRSELGLEDE